MSTATTRRVGVVGDHFMLPSMFTEALNGIAGGADGIAFDYRRLQLDWPDAPMVHGYSGDAQGDGIDVAHDLRGLREYLGDPDAIVELLAGAEIFVNHLAPVSAAMLERLPDLKLIAVSRGGPVNVDVDACRARGVRLVNTPGRNASAVAEFTVGAILAETRLITRGHTALATGHWRGDLYRADTTGSELSDMTVGIIGYGQIGTRVVPLLKPFGCRLLVCDPYVELRAEDARDGVEQVALDELLERADVVSLHPRVTPETTGMIGAGQLARMKPGAYLINTARGPLLDYDALYQALSDGRLRGAFLETFSIEPPPPDWPLLRLPNVTLTPHIAGASLTTVRIAARMIADEVRRYLLGQPLQYAVC